MDTTAALPAPALDEVPASTGQARLFGRTLLFALLLLASASVREAADGTITQAIVWLPTGVAIAGIWLLGLQSWWAVALCTVVQRLLLGYDLGVCLPAGLGSTAEAVAGVLILRKLGFRPTLARLRDVLALCLAAVAAPLASILCSWLGRAFFWADPQMPFYSGWAGWWRMNALGALTAVPVLLTWLGSPRLPARIVAEGIAVAAAITGLLLLLMAEVSGGATGVLALHLVLPIALWAAVRFGPRGAAGAGALAALVVALGTIRGLGPFLSLPEADRHTALQLFELSLVAVPLVFGALVAEREAALAGGVQAEELRRSMEEQLRHSQKMDAVGKLAGGIAHDFNNLLTAISGYGEAIREAVPAASQLRADADQVLEAADRAARLTRQLLAYSRQQVLAPQVFDLNAEVEQLGTMLRRLIGEDIELVIRRAPAACWARVDRGQLEQVLLNLAVNARDAMPSGGTLTIEVELSEVGQAPGNARLDLDPGPYVALSVRDTGVGMPRDIQARAFDPFFTTKAPGKGTGLGLSTVYGIVKQSGGAVWLDSRQGAGTTVWVYLPRVAPAAGAGERPASPVAVASRSATVLVIEDEATVRSLIRLTLVRAGHTVLEAVDGEHGLEVSRGHTGTIDLVISDVKMPRMGGRELVARLLAERPALRVLFISGYPDGSPDLRELAGPRGDFLQKPFLPRHLVDRVAALLAADGAGGAPAA